MEVFTTKGYIDDSLLERRDGEINNDREHTKWVEYWLEDELVHRSVDMRLKHTLISQTAVAAF